MTQLTRDAFITELSVRGWARFSSSYLITYMDWGLQDVYRLGKFDASKDVETTGALASGDEKITFTAVGTTAGTIHSINAMTVKDASNNVFGLQAASREFFWDTMYPNEVAPFDNQAKGIPTHYFVYGEDIHLYPVLDQAATWYVHYTSRGINFANGAATSGLPERLDPAVLAAAESHCCKRARDLLGYSVAVATLKEIIDLERANDQRQFNREDTRVGRYTH